MAKGKHAAALFEVIQHNKGPGANSGDSLRTPKWWFKGRPQADLPTLTATAPQPAPRTPSVAMRMTAAAPRIAAVEAMTPDPQFPASGHEQTCEPAPVNEPARSEPAPSADWRNRADPTRARLQRTPTGGIRMDRDNRSLHVRLRYPAAALAGFGLMVAVGLAYVVGRRAASGPDRANASAVDDPADASASNKDLRSRVQPNALNVPRHVSRAGYKAPAPRVADAARPRVREHDTPGEAPMANSVNGLKPIPPAAAEAVDGPRIAGLNYIIAQSYPDVKTAQEARSFLVKVGIPCTVEQGPQGWAQMTWYSVVTTRGFEHIHTPECESAQKAIKDANAKFAGTAKFRRFDPRLFQWK
ncbi:MAG TPA: hypothetical protein VFC78_02555 [Tepidisphaeraceae bacterium]|nr:hypothetical protein [Tepidisphaeraceae bacterium]